MTCEKHYWYHGPLVDCPHCEIDGLRAELEDKNKLLDSCSMQLNETANERNSLRAELARRPTDVLCLGKHGQITVLTDCPECAKEELVQAQEENEKLRCRNKAQHVEIKATTAYSVGQDKALAAQQKRIKELELALSEQYVKGMEEVVGIIHESRFELPDFIIDEIELRIAELEKKQMQEVVKQIKPLCSCTKGLMPHPGCELHGFMQWVGEKKL